MVIDETNFFFVAADGSDIAVYRWSGDGAPKAIVQIANGMGEHAARYRRLADALTAAGYVVYTDDHRGQGTTAGSAHHHGDLGAGGWAGLVSDLGELGAIARCEHPGVPLVVPRHSMGSFALQDYPLDHSADVDTAVAEQVATAMPGGCSGFMVGRALSGEAARCRADRRGDVIAHTMLPRWHDSRPPLIGRFPRPARHRHRPRYDMREV